MFIYEVRSDVTAWSIVSGGRFNKLSFICVPASGNGGGRASQVSVCVL